ncbi:sensor histidine kinase [Faecalicatena orotica]|uniref:sensor histidine kinase n=1 Tax=Faecalicatena orotica TaxID=1544 RepID=UPI0032162D50
MIANIYMFLLILILTVLYLWMIRSEMIKKLVVLVLVMFYAATQYLLVNLVTPLFPGGVLPDVYPPLTLAVYAGTTAIFFPLAALLMRRAVREYLAEMEMKNIRREFGAVLLATFLYFVMLMIYASRPDGMLADFWWWIIPPLLLTVAVLGIFYWTLFRESVRRKRDDEQKKALEIQKLQYESITREMEQTRRIRHDMRHSLNRISQLLSQGDDEAVKDYLSDLTVQVSHRDRTDYCKNTTVNSLLQYYVGWAEDKNIRCEVQADCGDITIAPVDLTVLLGNVMENAIRACEKMSENRWITVKIGVIGGSLVMQIANACQEIHPSGKYKLDGSFLPAAAFVSNRTGGGYGLYSLEHTAKKYSGNTRFCYDEHTKTFITRIRLNLHPDLI